MNRIVGIVEFESPFRFQLPFKLAKPSFESYFLLSKEVLMCISVLKMEFCLQERFLAQMPLLQMKICLQRTFFRIETQNHPKSFWDGQIFIFLRVLVRLLFPRGSRRCCECPHNTGTNLPPQYVEIYHPDELGFICVYTSRFLGQHHYTHTHTQE